VTIRPLAADDAGALEQFLAHHADGSMFLRSNARHAGLVDRGAPLQGSYVAAFARARITGVAAHYWNGMVVLQAPERAADLARAAVAHSGRDLRGFAGPWEQVNAARAALGAADRAAAKASRETLFALTLGDLVIPEPLAAGRWTCRHGRPNEEDLLTEWRAAYAREALGAAEGPALRHEARAETVLLRRERSDFVLEDHGLPVAFAAYNARLPDIVQIGGVWTPPALRGRGYGRGITAGALLAARDTGTARAVLFTDNPAAARAYEALGFRRAGEYGLVLLAPA
jgi:ribosomal protein S18 acetylase RimI-like enzyme